MPSAGAGVGTPIASGRWRHRSRTGGRRSIRRKRPPATAGEESTRARGREVDERPVAASMACTSCRGCRQTTGRRHGRRRVERKLALRVLVAPGDLLSCRSTASTSLLNVPTRAAINHGRRGCIGARHDLKELLAVGQRIARTLSSQPATYTTPRSTAGVHGPDPGFRISSEGACCRLKRVETTVVQAREHDLVGHDRRRPISALS